jgi:hypothetical protein
MSVTLREQLITGLETLGYARARRTSSRFEMFERGDGRFWMVGKNGALRIGNKIATSMPAPKATRYYVLTAPQLRPAVFELLDRDPPPEGVDLVAVSAKLAEAPALAGIPARTILNHVRDWIERRQGE